MILGVSFTNFFPSFMHENSQGVEDSTCDQLRESKLFDQRLKQFEKDGKTSHLPISMKKKLLTYFETKLHQQEMDIERAKNDPQMALEWGCCFTAAYWWLNYYREKVELLKKSIESSECKS
jgi:hypothetical protein